MARQFHVSHAVSEDNVLQHLHLHLRELAVQRQAGIVDQHIDCEVELAYFVIELISAGENS